MVTCPSCGGNVTSKSFCPQCGKSVQGTNQLATACPRCHAEVPAGTAFCMHCGSSLGTTASGVPAMQPCPACHQQVPLETAFCTSCGHNMRAAVQQVTASPAVFCTNCGRQNALGVRFCGGCGGQLGGQPGQYPQQQVAYQQPQQQIPYQQPYQQYPQQQIPYQQTQQYQQQPMLGQQPMVLHCPVCQTMVPMGTPNCTRCNTNLMGIVPVPGQHGGLGGFLQGDKGKMVMGALGGAAAVLGGEALLHGLENNIENRVENDMGRGEQHRHHHRDEGLLGGLGEMANDIGLF